MITIIMITIIMKTAMSTGGMLPGNDVRIEWKGPGR